MQAHLIVKCENKTLQELPVELDPSSTILDVFHFVKEQMNLTSDPKKWSCFSKSRNLWFQDVNQMIGISMNTEQFIIDCSDNGKQNFSLTSGFIQGQQTMEIEEISQPIKLSIKILDGDKQKQLTLLFNQNNSLEEIAKSVLSSQSLSADLAAIDLVIYGQNYNQPQKRSQTLQQLSIKNETEIEARIRWYGGNN